jgi:cystathionine beta-lyase
LQNAAICTSPSKAFNIAGLQIANITVPDADYRRKIDKAININEVCDVNAFGVAALQAAYNGGEQWLEAVNAYIHANYKVLCSFVKEQMPWVEVCRLEGTYLAWLHLCGFPPSSDVSKCLENEYGLRVSPGFIYGRTAGRDFLRLNLACPKAVLEEALARLKRGLDSMAGSYSQESC